MNKWTTYYKNNSERKPRTQLSRAISFCVKKTNALDIGAGNLIESNFLLENGFSKVTALDFSDEITIFANKIKNKRLEIVIDSFENFIFPIQTFDLINAEFSLPFYQKEDFSIFIHNITNSLSPSGVITGQFFGDKDSWNINNSKIKFHTKEQARELLSNLEILEFTEQEKDGKTANGEDKHWHIFNFIAKSKNTQ